MGKASSSRLARSQCSRIRALTDLGEADTVQRNQDWLKKLIGANAQAKSLHHLLPHMSYHHC